MKKKRIIIAADFETTTVVREKFNDSESYRSYILNDFNPEVYSWGLSFYNWKKDDKQVFRYGINIDSFMETILFDISFSGAHLFFHNGAKFDNHFILAWLFNNGFKQVIRKNKDVDYASSSKFDFEDEYENLKIVDDKKYKLQFGEFEAIIDDGFRIMEIKIATKNFKYKDGKKENRILKIWDSNLLFPSSIKGYGEILNKEFKTDEYTKLEIGYDRETKYESKEEFENDGNELQYLKIDIKILLDFLTMISKSKHLPLNKWKLTAAGTAYNIWKYDFIGKNLLDKEIANNKIEKIITKKGFEKYAWKNRAKRKWKLITKIIDEIFTKFFPTDFLNLYNLDYDELNFNLIRRAYQGGLTMSNPSYSGKIRENIVYADINSSYPSVMMDGWLPIGKPIFDEPEEKNSFKIIYKLIIGKNSLINNSGVPFLFNFKNNDRMKNKQYPYEINKGNSRNNLEIFLTDDELERVKKYYKGNIKYEFVTAFKKIHSSKIFGSYINHFYELKENARNSAEKTIAKLMLNSLYGKMGQDVTRKSSILQQKGGIREWSSYITISKAKFYLPFAIWITALARLKLVDAVGNKFDSINYMDTDSISIVIPKEIDLRDDERLKDYIENNYDLKLDDKKLGYWDIEHKLQFQIARRAKQYLMVDLKNNPYIKFAGLRLPNYNKEWGEFNLFAKNENASKGWEKIDYNNFVNGVEGFKQLRPNKLATGVALETYQKQIKPIWEYELNVSSWFKNEKDFKKYFNSL